MRTHLPSSASAGILLAFAAFLLAGCSPPPVITVHYLGHSSFVLEFGDGPVVLTDFGESNAYGLESPVFGLNGLVPDILTVSHNHADHDGGEVPDGVQTVLDGTGSISSRGLTITAIPTFESSLTTPDNLSFLFEYGGLKILHLGDCQSLMVGFSIPMMGPEGRRYSAERLAELIRETYPDSYDLVLLPIGFTRDIIPEAAEFAGYLDAKVIVPMHFWTPDDQASFLARMGDRRDERDIPYRSQRMDSPELRVTPTEGPPYEVEVVGLTPGPYPGE